MPEGTTPLPTSAIAGARTFDLRPFRSPVRFTQMPAFRTFVLVGLGFTGLGAVAGAIIGSASPAPHGQLWTVAIPVAAALFGAVGFAPLLLAAATRPTRYLLSLRLAPEGFTFERSSGPARSFRWNDPELAVSIARPVNPPLRSASGLEVERLVAMPGQVDGRVGAEARAALLAEAARHGLRVQEEPMQVPGERRDSAPSEGIAYGFAGAGPVPGGGPDLSDAALPPPPASAPTLPARFDLNALRTAEFESGAPGTLENELQQLTVTSAGVEFVDVKGREGAIRWDAREVRIELLRRIRSPAEPVRRADAVWGVSARGKGGPSDPAARGVLGGFRHGLVDGRCYAAIEASARAAGLWVGTVRFPGFGTRPFWLVTTYVRERGHTMYVA